MPIINLGSNFNGIRTITYENAYTDNGEGITRSNPSALSVGRYDLAGASVGDYALFAGGTQNRSSTVTSNYYTVDAYNKSLTYSAPSTLSSGRYGLAGASVGNYALFAGGCNRNGTSGTTYTTIDSYNTSLTRTNPTNLSKKRCYLAGASVGNYALFAGGLDYSSSNYRVDVVDAYNTSLTRSTATALGSITSDLAGASVGNYALFAGGESTYGTISNVSAYNTSLTRTNPSALSDSRVQLAGASVGNYALFAGGATGSTFMGGSDKVDAYNTSLTRSTPTALPTSKTAKIVGASVGRYALFGGGYQTDNTMVTAYDKSLVRNTTQTFSVRRGSAAGASVGDYALFAGGEDALASVSYIDAVDAYHNVDAYSLNITIPAYSKYKFTESSEQKTATSEVSKEYKSASGGISGYIIVNGNTTLSGNVS